MKVGELYERLRTLDPEMEVLCEYPSGDYWRTQLAGRVVDAEVTTVEWSEYHRQYAIPRSADKDNEEMERPKRVVLLK